MVKLTVNISAVVFLGGGFSFVFSLVTLVDNPIVDYRYGILFDTLSNNGRVKWQYVFLSFTWNK